MMTILLWFLFYLVSDHDQVNCVDKIAVSGYRKGSVIIHCQYERETYADETKHFCKMQNAVGEVCSKPDNITDGKRKFITADDTVGGVFSVLIRNLNQQDAGKYRCEAEGGENLKDVEVKVEEDMDVCSKKTISERASQGKNVTITCKLPCKNVVGRIYGYKVDNQTIQALICTPETSTANPPEGSFTTCNLTIDNVKRDDGGLYLCGAERKSETDNAVAPYVIVFSEMRLQVTDANPSSVGASGSRAPILIIVCLSVVLPLLLITGFALVINKLRHKVAQDTTSITSRGNNVNADEVTTGACSVEVTNQEATPTAIYSTVQKPSDPQDLYSLVQQPKAASVTEESNL